MNAQTRTARRNGVVRGVAVALIALIALLQACAPADLVDVDPPSTAVDPASVTTKRAAEQLYVAAIARLSYAYGGNGFGRDVITTSGFFTDELMAATTSGVDFDLRRVGWSFDVYRNLHGARIKARQAREALGRYYPDAPAAWSGRAYAIEAYTVLWFAELFCSGIPLSEVPLDNTAIPSPGLSTKELFERAIALFDSAAIAGADSAVVVNLARVGKARALLGLGRFADAAAAAQSVPTDFIYNTEYMSGSANGENRLGQRTWWTQIVDNEGGNGLVWSTDLRAAVTTVPSSAGEMRVTAKYARTSAGTLDAAGSYPETPIRLVDGLEARLIEAEADLAAGGSSWLVTLNMLRATCVGTAACAPVPGLTASSLPPLADPGTNAARIDLVMRERAMWLFVTGHRMGDLRRLAVHYGRDPETLLPRGTYTNPGFPPFVAPSFAHGESYGTEVVITPQFGGSNPREQDTNPLYQGCYDLEP